MYVQCTEGSTGDGYGYKGARLRDIHSTKLAEKTGMFFALIPGKNTKQRIQWVASCKSPF